MFAKADKGIRGADQGRSRAPASWNLGMVCCLLSRDQRNMNTVSPPGLSPPLAIALFDSPEHLLVVFFLVWTGIALLAKILFGRAGNAHWKRRAWPPFSVASSLVFIGFVWLTGFPNIAVGLAAVSATAITIYSMKMVWFCNECGGLALDRPGVPRPETCPRCGARRQEATP
jgi:hypothetical protein